MLQDFVLETCTAPGTGSTVNLAGAPSGRRSFAQAFLSGVNVYYFMDDGTQAEWGWGLFTAGSPNTLSRGTVLGNTSGTTSRLNFTGSTRVYNTLPSARIPWLDSLGNLVIAGALTITGALSAASATITGALSAASATITGALSAASATITGALAIIDPSTSSTASLIVSATSDANGANIWIKGNGTTTPSKFVRAANGVLQFLNDAYSQAILSLDDTGNLAATGSISAASAAINGAVTAQGAISSRTTITSLGDIQTGGQFNPGTGFAGKVGSTGGLDGSVFNITWTGTGAALFVDATDIGWLVTPSDRRVKADIQTAPSGFMDRALLLRVVTYDFANIGMFKPDGVNRQGFITQEVQPVIPSAVNGAPDAVNKDGTPAPQSLNPIPLIAENTGAIQELIAYARALEARVAALESK